MREQQVHLQKQVIIFSVASSLSGLIPNAPNEGAAAAGAPNPAAAPKAPAAGAPLKKEPHALSSIKFLRPLSLPNAPNEGAAAAGAPNEGAAAGAGAPNEKPPAAGAPKENDIDMDEKRNFWKMVNFETCELWHCS